MLCARFVRFRKEERRPARQLCWFRCLCCSVRSQFTPALNHPALYCPSLYCPVVVLYCPTLSSTVHSCPVLSCPAVSCPALPCPGLTVSRSAFRSIACCKLPMLPPKRQDPSKISRDRPLPELKQASTQPTTSTPGRDGSIPPTSRLQIPKVNRQSPSATRSRHSSIGSSPKSPPTAGLSGSLVLHTSPAGSLGESFDAATMGERTGPGGRRRVPVMNSPPSG